MLIKHYWRIAPTHCAPPLLDQEHLNFSVPSEITARFRVGQGLLLASWNNDEELGQVSALGICHRVMGQKATVQWRNADITLRPSAAGRLHWRTKPCFGFASEVVDRYGLADLFFEHFPELEASTFGNALSSAGAARSGAQSAAPTPGYVYLLKSPYGYKIGKTVNIRTRTRLFEVKLPFKFTLEHHALFDDYSLAERQLHKQFAKKRLEGEWFDLDSDDVTSIKRLGRRVELEAPSHAPV